MKVLGTDFTRVRTVLEGQEGRQYVCMGGVERWLDVRICRCSFLITSVFAVTWAARSLLKCADGRRGERWSDRTVGE